MSFVDFDGELDTQPAFEDFSGRLDGESDSLPKRAVQDTAVDLAKGVVGFGESVVGLADLATAGSVGNALQRIGYDPKQTKSFLEGFYTEDRKTANQAVSQADGFMDTLATMGANPSTIIGSIVESLPGTIGAGAVGGAVVRRALSSAFAEAKALGLTGDALTSFMSQKATEIGAQRAAILASSVAEGAQSAGSIAEAGRQAGRDWSEYALPAAAGGAATSLINVGSTKLANKLGIGDIETDIAMRQAGAGKFASSGSFAKRVPLEAVKEGVFEEMPQSWQEQIAQNIAEGRPDIFEGAGKAAAQGLVAGAGMGGGHAALTHSAPRPADILNTPNTQQAIDTFNAAVQADATASEDVRAIGALMQDYTAANRQTLEAAQAQLDAEVDQGDPLAVANPADVTNAAALARTAQADQAIAATLSDEEQGIGIPPAAADTTNLPDTSAPITGQRSLAQQVLEISRNGGPRTEAERGLMAMARRDLGEQKVAEIERLGQAPALMTRMEQKDVERGATPPITIVPNDNGVPIIRSQTPEISTAVNVELKAAGINTHTIDGTSIRVPKAQAQVAQQIVSRVNTRFTQPRQEQTLGTQAEETVPTEQGQPESQPAATLTLGNANHAQAADVRSMLGGQMSAEDHVGIIDNLDTLPTQVDANQGPRIGRPMAKTIKMLAGMLGRKVVFYETTNKDVAEGINRDGNTLYVNIDSNVDAVAVAGHEMVHSIEHEQPELYAVMLDATKALLKSGGRQRAVSYAKYAGARNIDSAARELLSDVGGNEWRSGQFWSDVFDEVHRSHAPTEARSIITKIRDAVVAFINKLIRATPKQGFQYGYTREELAEIRDNLVKATAESFRRAERVRLGLAPTPEAKAGEVRYSRRAGQTNYQYRADQLERAFEQMGLTVYRDSSRVSQSEYVEVESPEYTASEGERGEVLKFRVSDHELPKSYSQPDFDVIADGKIHGGVAWNKSGTWVEAVEWLAGMWKLPVPAVIRQTKERAVTQEKKDQARFKQGAVRYAQERLDVFDAAVAAGKVTGKKTNSGAWSLSGVPYVNLGTFPGESFDLNKAISRAREKLVAEVEARNMDAEGAPTPSVDPDSIGSRSLDTSRNEMQERPAVRADESGSPEEPAQSGGGAGSEAIIAKSNPRVFVEVAPDPNNSALTEAWRSQPYDERVAMSRSVFQKILPNVLSALGIKGEFSEQLGGYKLDTNPSFAALFDNANDAHRFSLLAGYALSQDSMMVLSGQKFDGAMDAGIIEIELPKDFTQGQVHSAYLAARGTWPGKISGHTTKDGIMHIVVPRKTALQVAMKVNKALGNKYPVHYAEGYYAFPQKKDYDYASIQGTSSAQLPGTREDASKLRAEASRLIQSELAKRGVRFSNQRQAPDAASGGLDGRGYAGNARTGISATGIHYSREQRGQLDSSFFGQGLNSEELERVRNSQDSRLRHRIYFYVNGGRGINPEQGVGAHAHQAELHHLYDLESDPRDFGLVADPNERESKILDSGYSGTIAPSRGIAVLIGPRSIPVEYKGYGRPEVAQVKGAEPSAYGKAQRALADRRDLPSGRMKGSEWQKTLPEMDLSHLDTDAYYYKDALLERPRFSAPRAQPWYYSQLEQGIRTMPAKVSGTSANNVALWLKSNADKLKIKKEEIEWSGVMDYLASLGKEKVTAEQLADWVAKNGVKVEEVVLGGEAPKRTVYQVWLDGQQISEAASMRRAEMYANMNPGAEVRTVDVDIDTPTTPKHASGNLVLPGGTDHREIVLTVPSVEPYNESDSTHYGDVGNGKQIAWARVNTRTDADGKKVLFVEEIQSQRNQHGRKKGFVGANESEALREKLAAEKEVADLRERIADITGDQSILTSSRHGPNRALADKAGLLEEWDGAINNMWHWQAMPGSDDLVPTAPFVSTKDGKPVDSYISLVLKRLIAYAVDTGHDRISWTTGEQQADRYDLSKQIKSITAHRSDEPAGTFYSLEAIGTNGRPLEELGQMYRAEQLEEVLGKDLAEKIINQPDASKTYSGLDLKVGGGWTASMYGDSRGLDAKGKPSMIAAAARKLGAEVGEVGVNSGIDTMDEEIRWTEYADGTQHVEWSRGEKDFDTESEAQKFVDSLKNNVQKQPGFTITPAMQEQASKGMPLFSKQRIIGDSGRQYTNEQKDLFKSAISNTGEFSDTNPDIRYSAPRPLTAEERAVEKRFYDRIEKQGKSLVNMYLSKNGTLIDPDLVKDMSPDYQQNPERWTNAVHEPSSMLSKMIYDKILEGVDETVPVVFTAGGGGSGKSESLKRYLEPFLGKAPPVVFDSTLSSFDSAVKRIDKALAKGAPVTVLYTNRPADKAFDFTLSRPRAIPIPVLAQAHSGAQETIHRLADHYGDRVVFEVRNNFGDRIEDMTVGNLQDVPREDYDDLERRFHEIATARFESGAISADRFQAVDSGAWQTDGGRGRQVVGGEQAQDLGSDRQGGNRRVGEEEGGVGQRESGVIKYSSRRLADDFAEQEQFLQQAAEERGYKDVEDFLAKDYQGFEKVAAEWRERNPADALFSKQRKIDHPIRKWAEDIQTGVKVKDAAVVVLRHPTRPLQLGGIFRPIGMDASHVKHILNTHPEILPDDIAALPDLVARPRAIVKNGADGWRIFLDWRDEKGNPLVAILTNYKGGGTKVTGINTMFGQDESAAFVARSLAAGDVQYISKGEVARVRGLIDVATQPSEDLQSAHSERLARDRSRPTHLKSEHEVTVRSDDGPVKFVLPKALDQQLQGVAFSKQRIIGDSGRQYTNEQKDLFKHVGREVGEKTTLEKLKAWIGKNWAQGLFDQFAPVKSLSNHAYTLMRLSKGATGAFEAFMRHGKLSIRDGAYDADTSGGVIDQVFIPLGKETTDFLYWIAGNRAERLVAEDREHLFTQAHIAAAKSLATGDTDFDYTLSNGTVTRKRALIFRDALKKFNDFSKNALDMAEQSGLIDGASRQYWEHEFYVPFYRVADEKDGGIRGMNIKQGVVRQKAFEMLKGGEEKLGDLLANTLMNWAHLIDASAKNRAAKTTIDAAVNLGAARKAVAGEKNVVWYSDKGRKAEFVVDDPGLLVALNGLEYAGLRGPAMDALSATKHWLTMGVTASPFFKVRNLIRDSIQSIAVSDLSYNPLHNVKEGWKLTNRASQEYVSALAGGGLIRFGTMLEGSEAARTRQLIKQGSKDSHILDGEGKLQAFYDKVIEPAWSKYQELGNRGEEINRMALYDKLIAEGKTHAEAALAARDLMDFSMSGAFTSVRFLTQVVPFLNARLQGLYKLGKGAKEDKARFAIVMAATALAGLAMMGYASGDDDRWKRWKKREQWDKDNYWMFSFGDVDYRIPKPFEIGAMATLVERGFETAFMLGDEKNKWSKFGQAVLKIAGDQLSMNPVPQLAKPILDIYANKDSFSGRPIETMSMERLKKDYRFSASTSMLARGASTAGNAVASVAGMEFLSPVQIDHLVRSYFGWVGTASVASADFMLRPMTNEPSRPEKDMLKWMSGGMVTDKDSAGSRYVSHLYDQLGELESAYGTWQQLRKEGKVDDAREFAADHRDELRQYRQSENVKQRLSEMNKQIRMIERSDRHPAEKRILINRIRARQSDMAERLN